ncbi:MAG: S8 family serine peptidase [Planctomycetota bacterium]
MRTHSLLLLACAGFGSALVAQSTPQTGGRVFDVVGSTVVRVDDALTTHVSRDGGKTWSDLPKAEYLIDAQYAPFDPKVAEPLVSADLAASAASRLFLVQFETAPIQEYRDLLRAIGAEVHTFIPSQSYLVRMDRGTVGDVESLSFVRWVGEYHPAYRMDPVIVGQVASGIDAGPTRYNILLVDQKADDGALESFIEQIGGTVDMEAMGGGMVSATLNQGQLMQVSGHDAVMWLDHWSAPEVDMNNALVQTGARNLHSLAMPIDGKGMAGHVYEGVLSTHQEFRAEPPYRGTPQSVISASVEQHGTNTAGCIYSFGRHPTIAAFRGGVPFAQMYYTRLGAGNRYNLYNQLTNPAGSLQALASTASWGGGRTTSYNATSAQTDTAIFDHDFFVTQSQSNAGARPSRPEAWAKNMASVGGFLHRNNSNPGDDCWCRTGSIGPASDGRIGVTLTGYYDSILTTNTGGAASYMSGFGGTSGATPLVNGMCQLGIQMFTDGMFGYDAAPTFNDRFENKPHFTTSKVMMMASARQLRYNSSGVSQGANRFQQGWGFPHVGDLYDARDDMLVIDEENATVTGASRDVLSQGGSRDYLVFVPAGEEELKVAMTYADPAPSPVVQSQHRLNDLDLEVFAPDGTRYPGNEGLRSGPGSAASPTATEDKDTEEMVILRTPASGMWRVTVSAPQVVVDSHVETAATDADYALAVKGMRGGRSTSGMVVDLISSGAGDMRVAVSGVPAAGWTVGNTFFSVDSSRRVGMGNLFGLEADILTAASAAFAPSAGNVFAFTNSAGQYPYSTFNFPAAVALAVSGLTFDVNVVLYDASGNVVNVSNTDRDTVQ